MVDADIPASLVTTQMKTMAIMLSMVLMAVVFMKGSDHQCNQDD